MSLYNISTQQNSNNLKPNDWNTGDSNRISVFNSNKSDSSDDSTGVLPFTSPASSSQNIVFTDRMSADSLIISSNSDDASNKDTLPDPLANFTYSYYEKISLAKYWKPINNIGDRSFRS